MGSSHDARPLVADLVRDPVTDAQIEQIRIGVALQRLHPHQTRRPVALVAVAVTAGVAALALGTIALWPHRSADAPGPGPILVADGGALVRLETGADARAARRVALSDGSSITLWPGVALAATENGGRRVALELETGRAAFEIEPGGPRLWSVDAGLVFVEVVGTAFTVDRTSSRVEVSVQRGRVRARSAQLDAGGRELGAGESLVVEAPSRVVEAPPDAGTVDAAPASPSWQHLADQAEYGRAYELLGAEGLRQETERADSLDRLMTLADVARLSGHPLEAVAPLELAVRRFPSDTRAAVAAFTLGRLESDELRRHDRAANAFRRCLELEAPRALREDAYARLAEAYARDGDFDAARAAASAYLERFPEGRHASKLGRWVEPR